ncbi:MAG TPA: hypothetical protein VH413_03665 [Verrucomicrobiae bacterium]|jgi:site-specific recombinase|nr:hypothetical protein [Verrucomicrobiae bacterium]
MAPRLKLWLDRFAGQHSALTPLDVLASSASPTDTLEHRLNWLVNVVQWIRRPGHEDEVQALSELQIQTGRLRRLLDVLDKNPEWKISVARTLRSIIRETSALELFCETGLPRQFGMLREIGERLSRKILPPPGATELGVLFDRFFPHRNDDAWIEKLDEATLQRFRDLLEFNVSDEEGDWNTLAEELEDALFQLAAQLRISGCSAAIRARIKHQRVRDLPFFKLTGALQAVVNARDSGDPATLLAELNHLRALTDACHHAAEEVLTHLEKRGVSTDVVYQLAFIEAGLDRFAILLELNFDQALPLNRIAEFVARLVRENRARESVMVLLQQNFHLLTRKIVERSGETGEHYIARTPKEYGEMLRRAAGGGVIMAFTTWFKIIILGWELPGLLEGFAASVNYSTGFVAIQLTGSTLATKQPANTAPALADRMHQVREPAALEALVNEIVCLIRSQFASIVGNLALVAPTMLALHFLVLWLTGATMMTPERAVKAIHAVSFFGPSILYAAFTGVLLWASSLAAAWADNWFVCHRIGEALETDQRLVRVLGTSRALRFGRFWTRNVAGLAGNISFGFMLGLIPEVAKFAGLPLDIRHVTLSSSMLVTASATIGISVLTTAAFWLGVIGILGIGCMNLAVSFWLAMSVAIRARGIQSPERHAIYHSLWARLCEQPLSFILPVGSAGKIIQPSAQLAAKV